MSLKANSSFQKFRYYNIHKSNVISILNRYKANHFNIVHVCVYTFRFFIKTKTLKILDAESLNFVMINFRAMRNLYLSDPKSVTRKTESQGEVKKFCILQSYFQQMMVYDQLLGRHHHHHHHPPNDNVYTISFPTITYTPPKRKPKTSLSNSLKDKKC